MTEANNSLLAAAAELGCGQGKLSQRLAEPKLLPGYKLLPGEIIEPWPVLSAECRAMAVLCARFLDDRNESLWE
jgi:hypothetical protein